MAYDDQNVFAKILRGEIPCTKVLETDHSLAFEDINAAAPTHTLVIPKGAYISFHDFTAKASQPEIIDFFQAVQRVAEDKGLGETGYRLLANHGTHAHQEVPHFHMHILGGRPLGPLVVKAL